VGVWRGCFASTRFRGLAHPTNAPAPPPCFCHHPVLLLVDHLDRLVPYQSTPTTLARPWCDPAHHAPGFHLLETRHARASREDGGRSSKACAHALLPQNLSPARQQIWLCTTISIGPLDIVSLSSSTLLCRPTRDLLVQSRPGYGPGPSSTFTFSCKLICFRSGAEGIRTPDLRRAKAHP
jgi:hypothetical protein